jgi:hypothetical protein
MPYNGCSSYLRPEQGTSCLAWLSDGVIIRKDPIDPPRHRKVIFAFTSADDLKTDISGFDLVEDEELIAG